MAPLKSTELKALIKFLEGNTIRSIAENTFDDNGAFIFKSTNVLNGLFFRIKVEYKTREVEFFKDYPDFPQSLECKFISWLDKSSYKKDDRSKNKDFGVSQKETKIIPLPTKSKTVKSIKVTEKQIKPIDNITKTKSKPATNSSVVTASNSNQKSLDFNTEPLTYITEIEEKVKFDRLSDRYKINGKTYGVCKYPLWSDNTPFDEKFYCGKPADSDKPCYCIEHKNLMFYYLPKKGKARK